MKKLRKLLVPTDFSDNADQALQFASILAMKYDSEITLFHVISLFQDDPHNPVYRFPDIDKVLASLEESVGENFASLIDKHKNIEIEQKTIRAISPAEAILNFACEEKFDLIVMGTHGRTGLSHFLMGSVAENVIRHTPCPVVTIKQDKDKMKTTPKLERIVVGVDFSNYSKLALAHAADLAKLFNTSIEVLHVIEERVHPSFYVTGDVSIFTIDAELRKKSLDALKTFVENTIVDGVPFTAHVREGRVHAEIVSYADEQNADLIVLATHGLSGLDHFLIGSTTEKVVRKAKTPVFMVNAKRVLSH